MMSIRVVDRKYLAVYRKLIAVVAAFMLLAIAVPHHAKAFSDVSSMTDAEFFGVWNGSAWTTEGKINYSYSPGLTAVENYAKQGDYTNAKAALLTYYQNRTTRTVPAFNPESRNTNLANSSSDNILTGLGERYLDTVTLTNTYQSATSDVTGVVQDALQTGGNISFLLMARYKEASAALFNSREQSSNKPTLEIVADGQTYSFTANKDTYIRPGAYEDTNYGTALSLEVKDSGNPMDENTRRAYINFDVSSLPTASTISSATLKLYGKHEDPSGTKDVMVYFTGDSVWGENTLTWNTTKGMTFSWQGIAAGPDWNQPASGADVEYLFLISRFGYLNSIVQEYTMTSDAYYADSALRLMLDFIQDKENNGDYPRSLDAAIRTKNWVTAYHYLVDSSSMDSEANTALLKYFWRMANFLGDPNDPNAYHPINNWAVTETFGLYMTATYFPEFVKSSDWTELAKNRFDDLVTTLLNIDGSYVEASSNYAYGVLASFNGIKEFANLNGLNHNPTFDVGVLRLAKYIVDLMLPNGWDPQYGDSDYKDVKPIVLKTGELYNDATLKYFGSGGTTGMAPSYTSTLYAGGSQSSNIAFMRSGWTADDLYMNVNAGWGGHGHPDFLAVNAYAYGQRLLIDPGRYSYEDDPIALWLRRATEAHNTIEINDTRQSLVTQTVKDWASNGAYDYFRGSSTAYSGLNHVRDVLFVKDKFWIVSDIVTGGTKTTKYQQTWHMLPDAAATLDNTTKKVTTHFSGSANIQVVPADPSSFTASLDSGYYSKSYQSVSSAPYASYVKNASGDVTFDTVLYPTVASDTNRNVKVTRLSTAPGVATTVATAFKVEQDSGNNGDIGYYYLSHEELAATARSFDSFNYDGKIAYVETDFSGNLKSALVKTGKSLKRNTMNLIDSPRNVNDMGIEWNGDTLEINGSGLKADPSTSTAIAIYAPLATEVKLNGNSVTFSRNGDYIYAVSPEASKIVSINVVNASTKVGTAPELPPTVTAVYKDYSTESANVTWANVNPEQYAQVGTFTVEGTVEGTDLKATATVTVNPFSATDDFSSVQGQSGWYYQKFDGSTYSDLVWNEAATRWENPGDPHPLILQYLQSTGSSYDAVRKWVAPFSGVVNVYGNIRSKSAYTSGDGVNVKIMKNDMQVWPSSGWQSIARDNTAGIAYNEALTINKGDSIYFIMNRNGTTTNDQFRLYAYIAYTSIIPQLTISSIHEANISTTAGTAPELPTVVTAVYSDNSTASVGVAWAAIDPSQYAQPGTFTVEGTVDGTDLKAIAKVTVNAPPAAANVSISGTAEVGQVLTGTYDYSDPDGDPQGESTFQWYRGAAADGSDKAAVDQATFQGYTVTSADAGKYVFFQVTPVAVKGVTQGNPVVSAGVFIPIPDLTAPTTSAARSAQPNEAGWNNDSVTIAITANDEAGGSGMKELIYSASGAQSIAETTVPGSSANVTISAEGTTTVSYHAKDAAGNTETVQTLQVRIDRTAPTITFMGGGVYTIDQTVNVTCAAADPVSGLASNPCSAPLVDSPAYKLGLGNHTLNVQAADNAGNIAKQSVEYKVTVTLESLLNLIKQWVNGPGANGIVQSLAAKMKQSKPDAFINEVSAQSGKAVTAEQANLLKEWIQALMKQGN